MIDPRDLAACEAAIRQGSYSFHAASRLLPRAVRGRAIALYAFCRLADDAVDGEGARPDAVEALGRRLAAAYAGRPDDTAADRAFAALIGECGLPRALPEALLDGFAWDIAGRRYETLADLRAYAARVAGAVGAMMTVLMGRRDPDVLARACDLGVAMQLTNIARDVGEDARAGRVYLPLAMLRARGIDPETPLCDAALWPRIAPVVRDVLAEADRLYLRAEAGVAALPPSCRPGILAARHNYAAIGRRALAMGAASLTGRARTTASDKLALAGLAAAQALGQGVMPRSAILHAAPLPETAFLVEAAAVPPRAGVWGEGRSGTLMAIFADLAARDRSRRHEAAEGPARA